LPDFILWVTVRYYLETSQFLIKVAGARPVSMSVDSNNFQEFLTEFVQTITQAATGLVKLSVSDQTTAGKWNRKQILGHLIDSAGNNHQRFVRAQFTNDLNFPGYEQDSWVEAQQYAQESWENLVQLWTTYNRHLLHLFSVIPEETLTRKRPQHNLDRIAFKLVPANEPATLEYFARDYVDHLRHHLVQIFKDEAVP